MTAAKRNKRLHMMVAFALVLMLLLPCFSLHAQEPPAEEQVMEPPVTDTVVPAEPAIDENAANEYFTPGGYLRSFFSDSMLLRLVPDSVVRKLQASDDFWYANYNFKKKKDTVTVTDTAVTKSKVKTDSVKGSNEGPDGSKIKTGEDNDYEEGWLAKLSRQAWFRALIWIIIIGGFLWALISYLINSDAGLFGKKKKKIVKTDQPEEEMPENIFEIKYMSEIDKAASRGDYRLAIRLMFLELLKNCAEKNIIQYRQERTNGDYLMQVSSTSYYKDFFRLTRHFEYAWYGKFDIAPASYDIIKKEFNDFNRNLN